MPAGERRLAFARAVSARAAGCSYRCPGRNRSGRQTRDLLPACRPGPAARPRARRTAAARSGRSRPRGVRRGSRPPSDEPVSRPPGVPVGRWGAAGSSGRPISRHRGLGAAAPANPEVLRVQAYLAETNADYATAIDVYKRAIQQAPERSYLTGSVAMQGDASTRAVGRGTPPRQAQHEQPEAAPPCRGGCAPSPCGSIPAAWRPSPSRTSAPARRPS